jgi:hypothetical protein
MDDNLYQIMILQIKTLMESLPLIWIPQGLRDESMQLHTEDTRFTPKKDMRKTYTRLIRQLNQNLKI